MPASLSDYIRPDSSAQSVAFQATSLGINLPTGANVRELPTGLSDYLRPQQADQSVTAQPQVRRCLLGGPGELVAGASNVQAPAQIAAASPALIGTGSAYDGQ